MDDSEELLPIGLRLRLVLFGLECAFGIALDERLSEKIFRDSVEDKVSEKRYPLFDSSRLTITARVEEYEPESIWLRVQGKSGVSAALTRVIEAANFHAFRLRRWVERDQGNRLADE